MEVTELLHKIQSGDSDALGTLIPLVYEELKKLAASHLRREHEHRPMQTTELVHEAYLKLVPMSHPDYENRSHFYGIASRMMRQVLVDLARSRLAQKRGGGVEIVIAGLDAIPGTQVDDRLLALDQAISRLEREHPRKARLIEMRYFGGITAEESATALDVPVHTVRRELRFAEAWLKREMDPPSHEP